LAWTHGTSVALALKEHLKAHESIDLQDTDPVYTAVTTSAGDSNLLKAGLPQQPLTEPFKTWPRQRLQLRS
jgi:hypothetical protein